MIRDLLILPDGRELFSGAQEPVTITELRYIRQVNGAAELDFGCACSAMLKVKLLDTTGSFAVEPGAALLHYRVDAAGEQLFMGTFYAQKPTRPGLYTLEFSAYDAMILAEQDLTAWLATLTGWPYEMGTLLELACLHCGLPIAEDTVLCNGACPVLQFAQQTTLRQLIAWVAGANAAYASINTRGELTFGSYTQNERVLTPGDRKSLKLSESPCAPIDRVAVVQSSTDVGVCWPETGSQTYTVTGNPLLAAASEEIMLPYVKNLEQRLAGFTYTPFEAQVFHPQLQLQWQPGQLVPVQSGDKTVTCAVFSMELQGELATLKSQGQPYRDSAAARYGRDQVKLLQGQMTQVQVDISGVRTEVSRVEGSLEDLQLQVQEDISALQVAADKISAQVSRVETTTQTDLDLIQQSVQTLKKQVDMAVDAEQVEITVTKILEDGVKKVKTETEYTFDENGLSVADSRSDIQNRIDYKGMYVSRGENVILQADAAGVIATDVKVRNYLVVGDHARLEDYGQNRTACFWL